MARRLWVVVAAVALLAAPITTARCLLTGGRRLCRGRHPHRDQQVKAAALALKAQGYLLQEDVRRIIQAAARRDVP